MDCDNNCLTCETTSSTCLVCRGDRKSPPNCDCPPGTYEDGESENCITCDIKCLTCDSDTNCLSCNGDRTL